MAISKTSGKFTKGGDTLDITPAAKIDAGTIKVVNGCKCLATWDIPANTAGALKVLRRGEVVTVTTDEAIGATNAEVAVYIDANGLVTKSATSGTGDDATSNTLLGYTAAAIGATDLSFAVICA